MIRFVRLMEEELERITSAISDKSAAMSLIRSALFKASDAEVDDALDEDEEDDEDEDWDDCSISTSNVASKNYFDWPINQHLSASESRIGIAQKAWNCLISGHDLSEYYFQFLIQRLQHFQLKKLKNCRLRIENAYYLVGAPDPCDVLEEGEVFVVLPSDFRRSSNPASMNIRSGKVVVSKNPINYVGDIRVLRAVNHVILAAFVQDTNGGVIFFSTKGRRRPADEMSGSDYDGDLFIVLFGDDQMVESVEAVEPFEEDECQVDPVATASPAASSHYSAATAQKAFFADDSRSNIDTSFTSSGFQTPHKAHFNRFHDIDDSAAYSGPFSSPSPSPTVKNGLNSLKRDDNTPLYCKSYSDPPGAEKNNFNRVLTEDDRSDEISREMYEALQTISKSKSIGIFSIACLTYADVIGPESEETLECVRYLRVVLDCEKTGKTVPTEAFDLARESTKFKPTYMVDSKLNRGTFNSVSIVGRLYDMVCSAEMDLNHSVKGPLTVKDKSLLYMHDIDCDLDKESGRLEWREEIQLWKDHLMAYNHEISSLISHSLLLKPEKELKINKLKLKYIQIFDESAKMLYRNSLRVHSGPRSFIRDLFKSRKCLASILYDLCSLGNHLLCWELCSMELHNLKLEGQRMAHGLSPHSVMLPPPLSDLLMK
mmetsp:Transcript_31394/g.45155  ORF Transcript_31394/g.45155 Transcript_31394/m.45155 type:complete len:656 (-) Transcript_31394:111-2078(-)